MSDLEESVPSEPPPELSRSIELLQAFQAGRREAREELFARYRPRLVRIVRTKVGPGLRQRLDEEDIVQETLLVAAEKLRDFELRSHAGLLQWLARIADNVLKKKHEHFQAEKRAAAGEVCLQATGIPAELATSALSPSRTVQRAELEALVDAYVQELDPPEYREVVLLRDYYLEEWEEIRRKLARPTVAAAQELHRRAHQRLRERMRKHLGGE
ncbi:MAG TPA: sigma-70 family RNA polymerase sigma factor [Planctomycetota bacterium]